MNLNNKLQIKERYWNEYTHITGHVGRNMHRSTSSYQFSTWKEFKWKVTVRQHTHINVGETVVHKLANRNHMFWSSPKLSTQCITIKWCNNLRYWKSVRCMRKTENSPWGMWRPSYGKKSGKGYSPRYEGEQKPVLSASFPFAFVQHCHPWRHRHPSVAVMISDDQQSRALALKRDSAVIPSMIRYWQTVSALSLLTGCGMPNVPGDSCRGPAIVMPSPLNDPMKLGKMKSAHFL